MAAAGKRAEEALATTLSTKKGQYIVVIEGSIPAGADGAYCTIGGRSALQIAEEACKDALAVIAVGTCAAFGGLPAAAPNPTAALSVADAVPGSKTLIEMPGMPGNGEQRRALITYFLTLRSAGRRPITSTDRCLPTASRSTMRANDGRTSMPGSTSRCGATKVIAKALPLQDGLQGSSRVPELPEHRLERQTNWPIGCGHPGCWQLAPGLLRSRNAILPAPAERFPVSTGQATADGVGVGIIGLTAAARSSRQTPRDRHRRNHLPPNPATSPRNPPPKRTGDSMTHIVVDPITRIEGHLRIEAKSKEARHNAWIRARCSAA